MKLVSSDIEADVSAHAPGTASRTADRRGRIVEAALRLFSETEYDSVQMDDLARAAGVAKPTLYRYFATKEELFIEGIERTLGQLEHDAQAAARTAATPRDALVGLVRCVLNELGRCTAALRAFDDGQTGIGERGRALIRKRVRHIRVTVEGIIRQGVESGDFRMVDPELAAVAVLGAIRMTAAHVPARRRGVVACELVTLFLGGLARSAEPAATVDAVAPSTTDLSP